MTANFKIFRNGCKSGKEYKKYCKGLKVLLVGCRNLKGLVVIWYFTI